MCDPVTATALALSAGGSLMESQEQKKNAQGVQDAKNNAYATGMARQRKYADETHGDFNKTLETQGKEGFDTQAAKEKSRFVDAFNNVATPSADYNAVPASAPKNVVIASQRANAEAKGKTDRDVNNMAGLSSYGNAMFNQNLDRSEFARMFGNAQDKASTDSRLIPLDMQSAGNNAQKSASMLPQLLKYGGMAAGMYNVMNPGSFAKMFSSSGAGTPFTMGAQTQAGFGGAPMSVPIRPM